MIDTLFWQQLWLNAHLLRPWWLLAYLPLIAIMVLRWRMDEAGNWQRRLPAHLRKALTLGETGWKKNLPLKALALLMALAILICAGPTWSREPSPFGEDQGALLILLDNSDSMLEEDIAPNRLARAKQKINDLLATRGGGRSGLVVFAGSAHTAMPLTRDTAVFAPFLAAIRPEIMPKAGKHTEQVIPLLTDLLADERGSTVLLISDGISPSAIAPLADYFRGQSHQLLILAAGDPAQRGKRPLELASLRQLASDSDGSLFTMTVDNGDVADINRAVARHFQIHSDSLMPWQDMGYYLLFPVVALLLLWFRKGWLVQWSLVAAVGLSLLQTTPAQATTFSLAPPEPQAPTSNHWAQGLKQQWLDLWLTPDQQGQWYFQQGDYLEAAKHYADPFYKGVAYYYGAEFALAQSAFLQADSEQALLYAGNALARQREYLAARSLFRQLADEASDPVVRNAAANNYRVMSGIVDEINRASQSQTGTPDGPDHSRELPEDEPRTAEGAEEKVPAALMERETLTADQILANPAQAEKWLRRVESDPGDFLQAKFRLQLQEQQQQQRSRQPRVTSHEEPAHAH
ncbi:vWA domain-containing protein [Aeromonas allosaccharophila]|uniref:vWA domain-containing protein n=1 Tax=Aeromonas allosaccharophila TaxID=656 RepID=UPI003D1ACFED